MPRFRSRRAIIAQASLSTLALWATACSGEIPWSDLGGATEPADAATPGSGCTESQSILPTTGRDAGHGCGDPGSPRDAGTTPTAPNDAGTAPTEPDASEPTEPTDAGTSVDPDPSVDAGTPTDPGPVVTPPDAGTDPGPPAPAPPGSVYADTLAAGWNLNGWGWSSTATETSSPAHGLHAIQVQMQQAWCGFVLAHVQGGAPDMYAAGTHSALTFSIYSGATPAQMLALEARLNNGNPNVRVRDWVQGTWTANTWMQVSIPFAALNPSAAPYHRIEWFNASELTYGFSLDDVTLVPAPPAVPHPASVALNRTVSTGQSSDQLGWIDAAGRPRSADFVDDSYRGGYIRAMRYVTPTGALREAHGGVDPSTGYQGFGYLVSHYDSGSNSGSDSADSRDGDYSATLKNNGHSSLLWQGKHHAIREYQVDLHPQFYNASGRGTVHATVHWLVSSGRSPITFSVTFDSSANPVSSIVADSRAPYGALAWDGTGGSQPVTGVSWGDKRRFVSDSGTGNLSMSSAWSYTQANLVPFTFAWASGSDAEMGLVDTRSFARGVSGGDLGVWFDGQGQVHGSERIDARCWNQTSSTATGCADPGSDGAGATMPATWAWPFQSVNYGLGQGTTSKKIAWGTNYGAVGSRSVVSFGERTFAGAPFTSYTTQVVLGMHSEQAMMSTVAAQESALGTTVTAQVGSVRTQGAPGVARTDLATFETAGFDPVYGGFALLADSHGRADFTLAAAGTLVHPLVLVDGATAEPSSVWLDGAQLTQGVDYYASLQGTRVWLTVNRDLAGTHALSVRSE